MIEARERHERQWLTEMTADQWLRGRRVNVKEILDVHHDDGFCAALKELESQNRKRA